jgi:hypothetical protein
MIIKIITLKHEAIDMVVFFSIQMCNALHILLKLLKLLTKPGYNFIESQAEFPPNF